MSLLLILTMSGVVRFIGIIIFCISIYFLFLKKDEKDEKGEIMYNENVNSSNEKKFFNNRAILLDTETTGLYNKDEIIELSLMLVKFNQEGELTLIDEYTGLREPNVKIHPKAKQVHGLDKSHLKNKSLDKNKCIQIFSKANFIIAHNSSFDKRFIKKHFDYFTDNKKIWLCSCKDIPWRKYGFNSAKLQNLLKKHNIKIEKEHRAKDDTKALMELLSKRNEAGITYFNILLKNNNIKKEVIKMS